MFALFCACLFICASWSPAGKGLTSWLSFVVSSVSLSLSHWYPGSGVVLDCIDSWSLQPYLLCTLCCVPANVLYSNDVQTLGNHLQTYTVSRPWNVLFVLIHIRNKDEVGTMTLVKALQQKYFTDRSKAVLLLWIFLFIHISCLLFCLVCSLQHCDHLLSLFSCVWCFLLFLSLSHVMSWVRCGTLLNRFLIFAFFITLTFC